MNEEAKLGNSETKKILVLGSNSFSGSHFVKHALNKGAVVTGVSRSEEPESIFLPYRWGNSFDTFSFYKADINNDIEHIMDLVSNFRPDYIVNFAAQSMVGESWENPEDWFRTNALSTVVLHNRLRREAHFIKKYVHVTTPEVYGSTNGWIKEETQLNPSTPYAVSRAAGDLSLKTFVENWGFPAVFTRAANVYGPGQQMYRIIPRTIAYIRKGKKLQLHGGGVSERSFIHIHDVSVATWKIMIDGRKGETYHISTNEVISIKNLVEQICRKMHVDFDSVVDVADDRRGKDAAYKLLSDKIREEFGWSESISLTQGLDHCIQWVDENIDKISSTSFDYVHKR